MFTLTSTLQISQEVMGTPAFSTATYAKFHADLHELEHDFARIGHKVLLLNARRVAKKTNKPN
jgi:hypothetical protein